MKKILLSSFFIIAVITIHAQDFSAYQKKWLVQGGDTMPYRILLPVNFDATKTYPVVFFLHGSGERGNDNEAQLVHGARLFLKDDTRKNFPSIVVFPQCSKSGFWSNVLRTFDATQKVGHIFLTGGEPTKDMQLLQLLVKFILDSYPADKGEVYVGGLSMGGMGTFELVSRSPGIFAAAFPICGGANPATAQSLKHVAWWLFHGAKDEQVYPAFSEKMFAALKKENVNVRMTIYPEANHNSWDAAFAEPGLLSWLFAQHR
ncbi:MAG: prolyl oligopeptidase family serine peptidase [Ferruginibacter sp.]